MATLIKWKDSYSVGVKQIDEQHKKLFVHINNLYSAMKKAEDRAMLGKLLDSLADYVDYHFSNEEKYFEKFGYNKKNEHILQHKQYIDKIKSFQMAYSKNQSFLSFEIIDFLEDWILGHVIGTDKEYTRCFNKNGFY